LTSAPVTSSPAPSPENAPPRITPLRLVRGVVRSMRPHQWTKNVLVFAAPFGSGGIDDPEILTKAVLAFVAFSLAASGTYLLNDARDVESDRQHPTKCRRPIAAGIVPVPLAYVLGVVSLLAALVIAFATARNLGITILAYLAMTTAYTLYLKHVPVYDIVTVAAGFVLRAVAGAAATDVPISEWFFIVTSFGALLMVVGKREGERHLLAGQASSVRSTLGAYSSEFLLYLRAVASGVVLIGYCLWAFEAANRAGIDPDAPIWFKLSIVPFAIAILRYALLLDRGDGAEPERLILKDRSMLVAGACWAIMYSYGVYVA
jgi:decaprenyl-phosphate phosphoribosyltransferase